MSSSRQTTYHQDYIARIRYSNVLPPPPNPPKLLDIPGTGLKGSQYTTAAFASRLAREQPLNIEADGELGMPIDLVGIPGVFEGDESAIYGFDKPYPPVHPHDKPLLRPLSMLGKPASMTSGVSFLRRTEYISSDQARSKPETPRSAKSTTRKRKLPDAEREDDPIRMLRGIYKGFDIAYPEDAYNGPDTTEHIRGDAVTAEDKSQWEMPKHPTDPDLMPLDSYPILPDLEAFPDSGNFFVMKFQTNPVAASDTYDERLDVALLRPMEPFPGASAQQAAQEEAYEADQSQPEPPPLAYSYDLFLPDDQDTARAAKSVMDVNNSNKEDPSLYDHEHPDTGRRYIRFMRQRTYETYQQKANKYDIWGENVALALHDAAEGNGTSEGIARRVLQKGAYFYPISQRVIIRPKRKAGVGGHQASQLDDDDDVRVDFYDVAAREPVDLEIERRQGHKTILESAAEEVSPQDNKGITTSNDVHENDSFEVA